VLYPCFVMSSGAETSLIFLRVSARVKNSQRFLDFTRNDKNWRDSLHRYNGFAPWQFDVLPIQRFNRLTWRSSSALDFSPREIS